MASAGLLHGIAGNGKAPMSGYRVPRAFGPAGKADGTTLAPGSVATTGGAPAAAPGTPRGGCQPSTPTARPKAEALSKDAEHRYAAVVDYTPREQAGRASSSPRTRS
ncbi:hypothetical protein M3C63_00500 [Brevibacterium luteolum]|uniref:hypothetical protein n=1 Tax=Brevibacterium luteolum TaxID=199591 RepID=UPI00223B763A|nr:hypothetical protein [Brevibacterium luteolum]MCT1920348.1 hypothetical protein [Brevibacterium luteolum]